VTASAARPDTLDGLSSSGARGGTPTVTLQSMTASPEALDHAVDDAVGDLPTVSVSARPPQPTILIREGVARRGSDDRGDVCQSVRDRTAAQVLVHVIEPAPR
jgi:hypothetical protein